MLKKKYDDSFQIVSYLYQERKYFYCQQQVTSASLTAKSLSSGKVIIGSNINPSSVSNILFVFDSILLFNEYNDTPCVKREVAKDACFELP